MVPMLPERPSMNRQIVARASGQCVGRSIRTGETPVALARTITFRVYLLPLCASIPALMQPVLTYLQENEPRFVRELCDYLRFPSVSAQSSHRTDVEAAARWLVEHCQSIGLH